MSRRISVDSTPVRLAKTTDVDLLKLGCEAALYLRILACNSKCKFNSYTLYENCVSPRSLAGTTRGASGGGGTAAGTATVAGGGPGGGLKGGTSSASGGANGMMNGGGVGGGIA